MTPKLSNLVPEKGLKTAEHSNSYLKYTICAKRRNLFNILWRNWEEKNSEMEKWGEKVMIRVQFMFFIFHVFLHFSKNYIFFPCQIAKYSPLQFSLIVQSPIFWFWKMSHTFLHFRFSNTLSAQPNLQFYLAKNYQPLFKASNCLCWL